MAMFIMVKNMDKPIAVTAITLPVECSLLTSSNAQKAKMSAVMKNKNPTMGSIDRSAMYNAAVAKPECFCGDGGFMVLV